MAMTLDGAGDYIDYGDVALFDALTDFTLAGWLQRNDAVDGGLIGKRASANGFELFYDAANGALTNTVQFAVQDSTGARVDHTAADQAIPNTGTWYHLTGTFIAGSTTGLAVYVDGVLNGSTSDASTLIDAGGNTTAALEAGRTNGFRDLNGQIAEVAAWNRALSAAEAAIVGNGFSPLVIQRGLIFYDKLVRSSHDIIGGLSGTLTGDAAPTTHPRTIHRVRRKVWAVPAAAAAARVSHRHFPLLGVG